MEVFRTLVQPASSEKKIRYNSQIIFSGSCFSENIGKKLEEAKFKVDNNPFGIVYNPLSVKHGLDRLMSEISYTENDLFQQEDMWCSFDHHSRFSDHSKVQTLQNINTRLQQASKTLKSAEFLFLTFGTSYVYELKSNNKVVCNCHKVPANAFMRRKISVEEITIAYEKLLENLFAFNPSLNIIFTVSPIRHWKDGAHESQLSKSTLFLAIDHLCDKYKNAAYFPSFEIMMDDLRDYRFYDEDMLHPNTVAISYIWQRFRDTFFSADTTNILKEVEKVMQAFRHKPFNNSTESFQLFARQQLEKINFLEDQYKIDLQKETRYFKEFIKSY